MVSEILLSPTNLASAGWMPKQEDTKRSIRAEIEKMKSIKIVPVTYLCPQESSPDLPPRRWDGLPNSTHQGAPFIGHL